MENLQNLDGLQLLVVDDDIDSVELIRAIFTSYYNVQVLTATCSEKAFQLITQFKPDILISDIAMPDEDGYVLMRKIRTHSDEQIRQIPAVALTALPPEESYNLAQDAGFTAHMPKPFDTDDLMTTVSNVVQYTRKCSTISDI
ncbi:response regulator [Mastigocladopsis repens]|uniref:response regulator n=1 Tax=Mastigocladopsis repens TaxID=221287 RepID=UPI00031781E8|nr:response regulator [Mastigocladopsis repens]